MAKKIVFIGSGSLVFTWNLVRDLLTFEKGTSGYQVTMIRIMQTLPVHPIWRKWNPVGTRLSSEVSVARWKIFWKEPMENSLSAFAGILHSRSGHRTPNISVQSPVLSGTIAGTRYTRKYYDE